MKFTFVTLFKNLISPYFSDSILHRAKEDQLIECEFINPRDFSLNRHKKVDDYKIGGGAGLLMSCESLDLSLKDIKKKDKDAYIIFLSPASKTFLQNDAKRLVQKKHIVFVCGRYEGIDERVIEAHADEIFSVGDFILTGGELPALCMCDAISRMKKGVLGNDESLIEESFENMLLEAPAFTKPNIYNNVSVPSEFLKGNHAIIAGLKNRLALTKTQFFRPDLYKIIKTKC